VPAAPDLMCDLQTHGSERRDLGRLTLTGSANLKPVLAVSQALADRTASPTLLSLTLNERKMVFGRLWGRPVTRMQP